MKNIYLSMYSKIILKIIALNKATFLPNLSSLKILNSYFSFFRDYPRGLLYLT